MIAPLPRVGIVGPLLGGGDGRAISQGQVLADRLREGGYHVVTASHVVGRTRRALDTARRLVSWRRRVDVVIVLVFGGPSFAMADIATLTAKWLGMPVVAALHGGSLRALAARHPRWVRRVLRRSRVVVAPSPYLVGVGDVAGLPVRVIPNTLPGAQLDFRLRDRVGPRLLWMRAFHEIYDPLSAIDVIARLAEVVPDASLTMAGQDDGLLQRTRAHADALGLGGRVSFVGFLGPDAKRIAFAEHDIFLNTSSVDNAPVGLLEAAAAGLPIVACSVGGIPELFTHDHTALLTDGGDVEALAGAVRRLCSEPTLAGRLSAAARDVAEQSQWPAVCPLWERLIAEIAQGAAR